MGHGDDHDFIGRESLGEAMQAGPRPHRPCRKWSRRRSCSIRSCSLADSARRGDLGRTGKGRVAHAVAIEPPMRIGKKELLGFGRRRRGERPDAEADERRLAMPARLEIRRDRPRASRRNPRRHGRNAQSRYGSPRWAARPAVKGVLPRSHGCGAVAPSGWARIPAKGWSSGKGSASDQAITSATSLTNDIAARHHQRIVHHRGIQRVARLPVGAGTAADAEIDAARRQRVENAELLGDLQGRVVRQHDAGAADADRAGDCRERAEQDLRRGARDRIVVVMLRDPIAIVAELLAGARQRKRSRGSKRPATGRPTMPD